MNYMMLFAVNLIVITVVGLSVQSCNGQCMYIVSYRATVLDTMSVTLFFVLYVLFNNYESEVYNAYGSTATQGGMLQICTNPV